MSFGDISKGTWAPRETSTKPGSSGDDIPAIGTSLQELQRDCHTIKESIATMRRRKIGPSEKNELATKIKGIQEREAQLKLKLDTTYQKIDALPRPEAAPKRTTLGKLMKDFDKVKVNIQAIMNEASLVKVVNERGEVESFARTPAMAPTSGTAMSWGNPDKNGSSIDNGIGNSSNPDSVNPPLPPMTRREKEQYMQQLKLKPLMHGQDVDDAIMEERERDIKKMNQDLILVNEMFKDMAELVDKQGTKINEIHTAADNAHDRAKAGLKEVNQAAEYQPGCTIC